MLKKILIPIVMTGLIFTFANAEEIEYPEYVIYDDFNFSDSTMELTLDAASEIAIENNSAVKANFLELENAEIQRHRNKIQLNDLEISLYGKNKKSIDYLQGYTLVKLSADFAYDSVNRTYLATLESVRDDVEKAYFNLLLAESMLDIHKDNLVLAEELHELTLKNFDLGTASKADILRSESNLLASKSSILSVENSIILAKMNLNTKLGIALMTEIKPVDGLTYTEYDPGTIKTAIESAFKNRKEIKDLQALLDIESINMEIVKIKYPEFNEIHRVYKEQKIKLDKAEKNYNDLKKMIEFEVRANYLDIHDKYDKIISSTETLRILKETMNLTKASYEAGYTVLTEVEKAQLSVNQANMAVLNNILDYNLAVLKYERSIGIGKVDI